MWVYISTAHKYFVECNRNTGIHHNDRVHMVSPEMLTKSFYVLGFDLTPDREADEEHIILPRQGNVPVYARFNKPLH